jgi:hypothetical protein
MPELLVYNPLWIINNQQNIVVNFHQDLLASMCNDFYQGLTDLRLIL